MALKGVIPKDIIAANKFTVAVDNVEILAVSVSGPDESLQTVELPDGTAASGGRTDPSESTIVIPQHATEAKLFMDTWWNSCKDPVQPTAYKNVTVIGTSSTGAQSATDTWIGAFIKGRKSAEYSLEDGTTMTVLEYSVSIDDVFHS